MIDMRGLRRLERGEDEILDLTLHDVQQAARSSTAPTDQRTAVDRDARVVTVLALLVVWVFAIGAVLGLWVVVSAAGGI